MSWQWWYIKQIRPKCPLKPTVLNLHKVSIAKMNFKFHYLFAPIPHLVSQNAFLYQNTWISSSGRCQEQIWVTVTLALVSTQLRAEMLLDIVHLSLKDCIILCNLYIEIPNPCQFFFKKQTWGQFIVFRSYKHRMWVQYLLAYVFCQKSPRNTTFCNIPSV